MTLLLVFDKMEIRGGRCERGRVGGLFLAGRRRRGGFYLLLHAWTSRRQPCTSPAQLGQIAYSISQTQLHPFCCNTENSFSVNFLPQTIQYGSCLNRCSCRTSGIKAGIVDWLIWNISAPFVFALGSLSLSSRYSNPCTNFPLLPAASQQKGIF